MIGDIYRVDGKYWAVHYRKGTLKNALALIVEEIEPCDILIPYGLIGPFECGLVIGLRLICSHMYPSIFQKTGHIDTRYIPFLYSNWDSELGDAARKRHNRQELAIYVEKLIERTS